MATQILTVSEENADASAPVCCHVEQSLSVHQARVCKLARHRHVALKLEISWDVYKLLNQIEE